jgi:hypothetical protein
MTTKTSKAVKMTENEQTLLLAIWKCEFHDGAFPVEHAVWTNVVTEVLGKSAQGAITSARKKGWVRIQGDSAEDRVIAITLAGAKRLAEVDEKVAKYLKEQNVRDVAAAVGPAPTARKLTNLQVAVLASVRSMAFGVVHAMQDQGAGMATEINADLLDSMADWESDLRTAADGISKLLEELDKNVTEV